MKKLLLLCSLLLTLVPFMQGCIAGRIKDSDDLKVYAEYRTTAEHNNTEREKAGLKPVDIPSFNEWRGVSSR